MWVISAVRACRRIYCSSPRQCQRRTNGRHSQDTERLTEHAAQHGLTGREFWLPIKGARRIMTQLIPNRRASEIATIPGGAMRHRHLEPESIALVGHRPRRTRQLTPKDETTFWVAYVGSYQPSCLIRYSNGGERASQRLATHVAKARRKRMARNTKRGFNISQNCRHRGRKWPSWRQYEITVRELSSMSNRELADLRITRSDIPHIAWGAMVALSRGLRT